MNENDKILAMLNDTREIENLGLRQSRAVLVKLRQKVVAAYRERDSFSAEFLVKELQPTLEKAAAIAHASGQRRALLLAKQGATKEQQRRLKLSRGTLPLEFDLLDKVAKLLQKVLNVSIDKIKKTYTDVVSVALKNLAAPVEEKVRETISDLIKETAPLDRAIETLDQTLNRLGVGNVEENKLEAVYRTQLQTSFNAGRWQEDQSEEIQEILWGYKYVTAGDDRVREEHAALDGTTLPKDDPFWDTYWPPNGWNCRCQVIPIFEERKTIQPELLEDGSMPQPDEGFEGNAGKILGGDEFSYRFSGEFDEALHPRDERGRFSDGGGSDSGSSTKTTKQLTGEQEFAVRDYKNNGYRHINKTLREDGKFSKPVQEQVDNLDKAVADSELTQDTKAFRVIEGKRIGDKYLSKNVGDVIEEKGFMSTSTKESAAFRAVEDASGGIKTATVIEIEAPKGTNAFDLKSDSVGSFAPQTNERELLFGRNTKMQVRSVDRENRRMVVKIIK